MVVPTEHSCEGSLLPASGSERRTEGCGPSWGWREVTQAQPSGRGYGAAGSPAGCLGQPTLLRGEIPCLTSLPPPERGLGRRPTRPPAQLEQEDMVRSSPLFREGHADLGTPAGSLSTRTFSLSAGTATPTISVPVPRARGQCPFNVIPPRRGPAAWLGRGRHQASPFRDVSCLLLRPLRGVMAKMGG